MRTALRSGANVSINGIDYTIESLISASGGMSLIYEAIQNVGDGGFAGKTVIKEFFPISNAKRDETGRVVCASQESDDVEHFNALRRSMIEEGIIGEDARNACSQVYAFDQARDGYAVMRKLSKDTLSLTDILNSWQTAPPTTDEEYADMARLRYALRITHSILTGLQTIHDKAGIIHRDISLGNIVWASAEFAQDGRDGRAYFLDFGSALRMDAQLQARNVSDPRDLFGTYSFAAPEIWALNGILTPSTDLFSVSAILLLLCCGKKCCIRMKPGWHLASQANIGRLYEDDFVVRGALEKLNIPPDIRGRLLDFLLEGLFRDPSRRFGGSSLKMLEALEALQVKCAPRQRLREYAAFISYHHRPLDKAVARRLQRLIEQYRIPAELAGDRESNRLGLVFRDEDELPVSTDLTDNIQEALDHSDFLIVVCTPGTPDSIWVEQEIAYFLRHHDRNHVLAVLAEGHPDESFPPHLVHFYDADGNIIGNTEYLAANITGKNRRELFRNLNREKLRIIAAMLGCPYDSLYQRERRYRSQRITAIACMGILIVLIYAGTLIERNRQISLCNAQLLEQKHEIQLNESELLVKNAREAHEEFRAAEAMRYALNALPVDSNDDRPYYPPAESILLEKTGILTDEYGKRQFVDDLLIKCDYPVTQYEVSPDGRYLVALDEIGHLLVHDPFTGEKLWENSVSPLGTAADPNIRGYSRFILSAGHSCVIAIYDRSIACYALSYGGEMWRYDLNNAATPIFAMSGQEEYVALVVEANNRFTETWDIIRDYDLVVLRIEGGEIYRRIGIVSDSDFFDIRFQQAQFGANTLQNCFFFDDDRCFAGLYYSNGGKDAHLFKIDLEAEACDILYSASLDSIYGVVYAGIRPSGDRVILVMESGDSIQYDAGYRCVDINTGALLWEGAIHRAESPGNFVQATPRYHVLEGKNGLVVGYGNRIYYLDANNGEVLPTSSLNAAISCLDWSGEPGFVEFILENGQYGIGWFNDYGFFSYELDTVGANAQSAFVKGGYLEPRVENGTFQSILSGSISEGFGYVVAMPEEPGRALRVSYLLPRAELEEDKAIFAPDEEYRIESSQVSAPLRIIGDHILISELDSSYPHNYRFHWFDVRTKEPARQLSMVSTEAGRVLPLAGKYGLLTVNEAVGAISCLLPETGSEVVLAERRDEELSKTYVQDVGEYVILEGPYTAASWAYLRDAYALLTAWCDGTVLRWWLDGEEQPAVPLPENACWQLQDNRQHYRWLKCGANGNIVLSHYSSVRGDVDTLEGFEIYDTRSKQWHEVVDEAHGSSDRHFAVGEASTCFAVFDSDGFIRTYDAAGGGLKNALQINISEGFVREMKFILDDRFLLLRMADNRLWIIDPFIGEHIYEGTLAWGTDGDTQVSLDSTGHRAVIIDSSRGEGLLVDALHWQELARLENVLAFNPNTDELYMIAPDNTIYARHLPDLWGLMDIARQMTDND